MSVIASPDESMAFDIFRYCQLAFAKEKVRLTFPNGTEPQKTYKWRYLVKFAAQVQAHNLSLPTAYRLIDAMIKYAVLKGQLRSRGLSILTSANIFDIGYRAISQAEMTQQGVLESVKRDSMFLDQFPNRIDALSHREVHRGGPNLIRWYVKGKLSIAFLAVSKSSLQVMRGLTDDERLLLPTRIELEQQQRRCCSNIQLKHRLKLLLGADWGLSC